MRQADKVMNHRDYPKTLKNKENWMLRAIITDCKEAIAANPENPNNGYYQDEICYCGMELKKRIASGDILADVF